MPASWLMHQIGSILLSPTQSMMWFFLAGGSSQTGQRRPRTDYTPSTGINASTFHRYMNSRTEFRNQHDMRKFVMASRIVPDTAILVSNLGSPETAGRASTVHSVAIAVSSYISNCLRFWFSLLPLQTSGLVALVWQAESFGRVGLNDQKSGPLCFPIFV